MGSGGDGGQYLRLVLKLSKQDPAEQKDLTPTGSLAQGVTQTSSVFSFLLTSFKQLPFS